MKRYYLLGVIALLVIWLLYANHVDNALIMPQIDVVFIELIRLLGELSTYQIVFLSFFRLITGLVIAMVIGVFTGLLSGVSPRIEAFLSPLVSGLRTLPVASIIVIILILLGTSLTVYVIPFLMIFPVIAEATKQGVKQIHTDLLDAAKLEDDSLIKLWFNFYLPLAFPYIKTGFLQSVGLGFKVLVMAEFIAQSPRSIGRSIYDASLRIQYDTVFAWTIIVVVIVILLEKSIRVLKNERVS